MDVRTLVTVTVALFGLSSTASADNDPALLGCWRSQQIQMTFADRSSRSQNGDCVVEYDATHGRSRCHNESGEVDILSSYQLLAPGQLRVTPIDPATGSPKGPPADLHYRIEDDWLLIDRQFTPAPNSGDNKQPTSMKSVSVREGGTDKGNAHCEPRGETGLRIGRTSRSSLALTVPAGWQPSLVDPVNNKELALAINTGLFIGAFVPNNTKSSGSGSAQFVVLIDDTRPGPIPVRAAEFDAVKKRFASEPPDQNIGELQFTCDEANRICASLRRPDGRNVYSELVNVRGRVVIVSAITGAASKSDPTGALRKSVRIFVKQLRSDNAG